MVSSLLDWATRYEYSSSTVRDSDGCVVLGRPLVQYSENRVSVTAQGKKSSGSRETCRYGLSCLSILRVYIHFPVIEHIDSTRERGHDGDRRSTSKSKILLARRQYWREAVRARTNGIMASIGIDALAFIRQVPGTCMDICESSTAGKIAFHNAIVRTSWHNSTGLRGQRTLEDAFSSA